MKITGVNYSQPQQSNYIKFSGRANSYDELITIIPDYKNALEKSLNKKVDKVFIYSTYLDKQIII